MVASKSEADKFVNDTILMLDDERARIKQAAHEDLDRSFALAFQDREQAISAYADWYFEWKRSYVVLKETISSAITRFFEVGKYESLNEAIEADVKDYFLTNYKEQVLKPELRDQTITKGVEQAVRHAHDSYRRVIANGDMRLQLFLAQAYQPSRGHPGGDADDQCQARLGRAEMEGADLSDGGPCVRRRGRVSAPRRPAARWARWRLAPRINRVLAQSFAQLSRRVATSLGTRLAFAQQGAVAGTVVQPMGGQVVGAAIGVLIGAAVDYLSNAANEAFSREGFVAANDEALDATIATWKSGLEANIDTAIDKWFDDARASVVLAAK